MTRLVLVLGLVVAFAGCATEERAPAVEMQAAEALAEDLAREPLTSPADTSLYEESFEDGEEGALGCRFKTDMSSCNATCKPRGYPCCIWMDNKCNNPHWI